MEVSGRVQKQKFGDIEVGNFTAQLSQKGTNRSHHLWEGELTFIILFKNIQTMEN